MAQVRLNFKAIANAKIINQEEINTANLESSPTFIGDKIGYVYTGSKGKFFDKRIDEPFFDIGIAEVNLDNSISNRATFYKNINSDLHEGAMAYDLNSNILYFTRSYNLKSENKKDTTYLRIMQAKLNDANPNPEPLTLQMDSYNVCHPSISSDGKSMIFASNKNGGIGKMDLYVAYSDGKSWSGVTSLGQGINSPNNEIFPYILNDTILLFASDREGGFGGLDIYTSELKNGEWTQAILLPKPFNTSFDDFGLICRPDMKSGYLTSTRLGGEGKDDLYAWSSDQSIFDLGLENFNPIVVHVVDKLNLLPLANVEASFQELDININDFAMSSFNVDMMSGKSSNELILKLKPKNPKNTFKVLGNSTGDINFELLPSKKYLLQLSAPGYQPTSMIYDYKQLGNEFNMVMEPSDVDFDTSDVTNILPEDTMTLEKATGPISTLDDELRKGETTKFTFRNLYFDYNSHRLRNGAASELDAVYRYLLEFPEKKIRLESHTDSRGTAAYNLHLSILRAESARRYLINQGIEDFRIDIKGYGESKLLNDCIDKKACTDAEHEVNRRIELIVIQ
jgi:outer membrane protein OmpA-like peptidoglycan-associated protein